jgi:hypothetical protein
MSGAQAWFGISIDILAFTMMSSLAILCIFARDFDGVNKVLLAMLLTSLQYF